MFWKVLTVIAAATLSSFIAIALAQQPTVMGLVAGPVGVGYPVLRTVPGSAAAPAQTSGLDVTTGEFFGGAGQQNAAVSGVEVGRWVSSGYANGGKSVAAVSAAAGTTLSAANMLSGLVNRTGPSAGFTDTTDTAANIDAALGGATLAVPVGMSFDFEYADGVAFAATLAGGTNVTIVGSTGVVASGSRLVRCVKTAATPAYSCG